MLRLLKNDNIFALSSAPGRAGVSIIRISGPKVFEPPVLQIFKQKFPDKTSKIRQHHTPILRTIIDPNTKEIIDPSALILHFNKNHSFTGEDTLELHLHGGPSIVKDVLKILSEIEGNRIAEKGEFSQRAFLNGRISDLTQCEALAGLIDSETSFQRKIAASNFTGATAQQIKSWKDKLLKLLAYSEADLDFGPKSGGDTQILEDLVLTQVLPEILNLKKDMTRVLETGQKLQSRVKHGVKVAIVGEPNVGKSSLINLLSRQEISIVTSQPGTTRDVLSVNLDLGGYPLILYDTAGIRNCSEDEIENIGIEKAKKLLADCDICLKIVAAGRAVNEIDKLVEIPSEVPTLTVMNKVDLLEDSKSY